jgi:vacuolar-type H+-ATPase subunit I/STV1
MEMHIAGRRKKGYINGRKAAPAESDPSYDDWEAEDALVKGWLINSMTDKLMTHFVQCGTAKDVWDAVKRSYLDVSDSSQVYELMKKSFQSRQEGRPLSEYYNELNSIFLELDYRRPNDMSCPNDVEKLRKRTADDRVYVFLAGLDHSLDHISSRILAATPLPSLEEVYSQVRREEQRQLTMGIEDRSEVSALVVHKNNSQETTASRSSNSLSRFCTYCNKNSHTEDICWKKHGYPEWYKLKQAERKSKKSAQVASIDNPTSVFHVTRASPKEGNSGLAFISAATNTWVIDSGALIT